MTPEQVSGAWVHVHEEDTGPDQVYRPLGTELPPSRGRSAIELRPDGSYVGSGPGADDVPEEAHGTWSIEGDVLTLAAGATPERRLTVVEADGSRLVVRRAG